MLHEIQTKDEDIRRLIKERDDERTKLRSKDKEIERLQKTIEIERTQFKSEMSILREQADKNSIVNRAMVESIVGEQVNETEQRVRKEFEN